MRAKPCLLISVSSLLFMLVSCVNHTPQPIHPGDPISGPSDFKRPPKDGKPSWQVDVSKIPDAVPRPHKGAFKNSPYQVFGKTYYPLSDSRGYREVGLASWYGTQFHSRATSNGEIYDLYGMTAAHKTLPLPSYVRVTNLSNGRAVILRVNDRGPFHSDRIIDLSYAAALKLGYADSGVARVQVEAIDPRQWQPGSRLVLPRIPSDNKVVANATESIGAKKKSTGRSLWPVSPGGRLRQSRNCRTGKAATQPENSCDKLYQSPRIGWQNLAPGAYRSDNPAS